MTKTLLTLSAALIAVLAISSCATVKGIGRDVQSIGQGMEKAAR